MKQIFVGLMLVVAVCSTIAESSRTFAQREGRISDSEVMS